MGPYPLNFFSHGPLPIKFFQPWAPAHSQGWVRPWVEGIQLELRALENIGFIYVSRDANVSAHVLAKKATSLPPMSHIIPGRRKFHLVSVVL
jgi:hypothetical protein